MVKFLSFMLCTSKIHPFHLGTTWELHLSFGNLMIIRVTSVEWTWLGLEWPPLFFFVRLCVLRCLQHG